MAKKGGKKGSTSSKIEALRRAQQINELLMRSTIESEALQNTGEDRPVGEQHLSALLTQDTGERRLQETVTRDIDRTERLRGRTTRLKRKARPSRKPKSSGKKPKKRR